MAFSAGEPFRSTLAGCPYPAQPQ